MAERILIADDQEEIQDLLRELLAKRGAEVTSVGTAQEALDLIVKGSDAFDLAILDLDFGAGQMNGLACLEEIRKATTTLPVVILTGKGTVSTAAESIKLGAEEFVEKDFYLEENMELALMRLDNLIRTTIDNKRLRREREFYREELKGKYNIVGESPQIQRLIQQIQEVAPIPRPVLIRGERGTGKELVAAAIHRDSHRKKNAFITINCAALAEGLLECELFGQEDNAFTNSSFREGRFVLADKGTLFLDEIGNMSFEFQQKILRVLEYQQFERVGGSKTLKVDVRVLAATNSDLELDMQQGKFREDLYDRLAFETIWLPPLRERREDIELLCYHFMERLAAEVAGVNPKKLLPETLDCLNAYRWPGNVRQLKYIIEQITYKVEGDAIAVHHLPEEILAAHTAETDGQSLTNRLREYEKQLLVEAYAESQGDLETVARHLSIPLETAKQLVEKHQIL
ncbi:MAG: sigma-54 dependent transcriptional regulator [Candidatus Poribacteria bacterium]|nr:sigma-54 dependent transcriptional regulator [Candidatus Poribacteria bacterium]MDE0506905.1 sigma-54 dependent transcriptional regulator [Candidatus Poribacteria bacterium]